MVSTLLVNNRMDPKAKLMLFTKDSNAPLDLLSQAANQDTAAPKFVSFGGVAVALPIAIAQFLRMDSGSVNGALRNYEQQFLKMGMLLIRQEEQVDEICNKLEISSRPLKSMLTRYGVVRLLTRRCVFVLAMTASSAKAKTIRQSAQLQDAPFTLPTIWRHLGLPPQITATGQATPETKTKAKPKEKQATPTRTTAIRRRKDVIRTEPAKQPAKQPAALKKQPEIRKLVPQSTSSQSPDSEAVIATVAPQILKVSSELNMPSTSHASNGNGSSTAQIDSPASVMQPLSQLAQTRRDEANRLRAVVERLEAEAIELERLDESLTQRFGV